MKSTREPDDKKVVLQARAVTRYVRISPQRVRLVLDAIRGKHVSTAFMILAQMKKKGARVVEKTLKSVAANAKQKEMDENRIKVAGAFADGGPVLKRFQPRSMGRAGRILKRTAHITLVLKEGTAHRRFLSVADESKQTGAIGGKPLKIKKNKKEGAKAAA